MYISASTANPHLQARGGSPVGDMEDESRMRVQYLERCLSDSWVMIADTSISPLGAISLKKYLQFRISFPGSVIL